MMQRIAFLMCGAVGGVLAWCAVATAEIDLQLRERIAASSTVVRLGDVAEIRAADREAGRRLAGRLLMPAPAPGTRRYLRRREIQDLLAAHGEDISQLRFSGAASVEVAVRASGAAATLVSAGGRLDREAVLKQGSTTRPVTRPVAAGTARIDDDVAEQLRDELRLAVVDYLTAKAGHADAWRVTCSVADRHLAQLRLATTKLKCFGGVEPWTGKQRMIVSFATADGMVQVPFVAEVGLASQVVTVIRPVERGGTITAANVELDTVDFTPQASERRVPITSVEEVVGMEARQALRVGDVLFTDLVQTPVLVKRGDLITVVSQGGGIRVRTTARARQDGAEGELIQVEAIETRQTFDARVTGLREATVFAASPPVRPRPNAEQTQVAGRR